MSSSNVHVVFNEEDLPFEEELLRNPKSLKSWLRYIEAKSSAPKTIINMIFERAIKELPGSYKLWYNYLKLRRKQVRGRCVTDPAYDEVNNAFERALVFMNKMPRIWMDYCSFLVDQMKITRTRRVFDRALRALPITQHERIWKLYVGFVCKHDIPETAVRVFRRYLQLCPENAEEYIDYLKSVDRFDEAASHLAQIVNNQDFVSKQGKSNHALWHELCELISKNPHKVKSLNVDAIIRGGLRRYTDQVGHLWNSLADYYIRSGLFERARDIYEEAIRTVTTVRDFTQVFDSYAQFEELALSKKMEDIQAMEMPSEDDELEVELFMARFEDLMERRPLMLNSVLLRQNPHNVSEWHKRISLLVGKPHEIINTYTEAVQTVDPRQAVGKMHSLWVNFAKFYEENKQLDDARIIFEKATHVSFIKVDDLATIWCEWVEMELRHDNHDDCLKLLQRATVPPPRRVAYHDSGETVQMRLHKSLKVWSLYADLEESFGTFKSTKAVYDRVLDLKIATPQIIINYGLFLKEHNYFEEAFKCYEKGISLFKWPNVFDIWNTYLTEFLDRYGGTKLERARDLFEQCLESCPAKFAKPIYLLFAKLEEQHGMARHAMSVYDRAIDAVDKSERFALFNIYLRKAAEIYGVTRTRQIYEKAIEVLADREAREMCQRFAELETKLGEIDRARAIYAHCSQMCDPRVAGEFWQSWKDFEVKHGNEDTVREMLRIKRSVQHTYNTQVNMMSAQMLSSSVPATSGTVADLAPGDKDDMRLLEAKVAEMQDKKSSSVSFVRGETQSKAVEEAAKEATTNPDEIDLDDGSSDDDENSNARGGAVEEQAIPSQVFGGLKKDA
jgi:pre-mRNA-splicing factor SYF1